MDINTVRLFKLTEEIIDNLNNVKLTNLPSHIVNTCYKEEYINNQKYLVYDDNQTYYEFDLYTVINNLVPNNIRKSLMFNIAGTDTKIIDPNEVLTYHTDEDIKTNEYFKIARNDEVIDRLLYTKTNNDKNPISISYISRSDGYQELMLVIPQSGIIDLTKDDKVRYILAVFERNSSDITEDNSNKQLLITSTALLTDDNYTLVSSSETNMLSSGEKIIRILLSNNTDKKILPYFNSFSELDLGILEIMSNLSVGLDTKVNTKELKKFMRLISFSYDEKSELMLNQENPILFKY